MKLNILILQISKKKTFRLGMATANKFQSRLKITFNDWGSVRDEWSAKDNYRVHPDWWVIRFLLKSENFYNKFNY
jgi:hypothetical protein